MIGILTKGFSAETAMILFAFILAIIFCMTIHEYAHAKVALLQGDDTAYLKGRLTLNPLAHIDPIGFISLMLLGFGWARPVPVNPLRFKDFRKGIFLVSIAGIVVNIFAGFFSAGIYVLFSKLNAMTVAETFWDFITSLLTYISYFSMFINLNLALFNLIPIAPLDGYNVLRVICSPDNNFLEFIEKYSLIISIVLLVVFYQFAVISTISGFIINPFIEFWKLLWVF